MWQAAAGDPSKEVSAKKSLKWKWTSEFCGDCEGRTSWQMNIKRSGVYWKEHLWQTWKLNG